MPPKDATVERVQQRIDADLMTELVQHPSRVQRWFIDNIFRRSLAYLVAFTEAEKAVIVRATAGGKIKTAPTGTGFTVLEVNTGTCADAYGAGQTHEFTYFSSRWDILVETFEATISLKNEAGAWSGDVSLPKGMHSLDFSANGIKLKNRSAGSNAIYEVVNFA